MLSRAYSLITVKSVDEELRIIEGIASTPEVDRMGDVVEPDGAIFRLPMPLLWQHQADQPIGHVLAATVTKAGIKIRAQIAKDVGLADIERAWALIKSGLVRGLSIGFKAIDMEPLNVKEPWGGQRFTKWEWLELSAVTIAANGTASIALIKSLDAEALAKSGRVADGVRSSIPPVVSGHRRKMQMTHSDKITALKAQLTTKTTRMHALDDITDQDGIALSHEQNTEYASLVSDVKDIGVKLDRLDAQEQAQMHLAGVVSATDVSSGARARVPHVEVKSNIPPGIGFARYALCKAASFLDHRNVVDVVKERYPHDQRLIEYTKGAVPAGTTSEAVWASPLVYAENLASEFIEFLRPMTIVGKFGQGNIPSLTRVPFNVRITGQTNGGNGYWVGQGAPKPLTSFAFEAITLGYTKVAAISVITQELARFSSPSAETRVRDGLTGALIQRLDTDFVDPAHAAVTNVSPASITNGLVAKTSAGVSADNARTDLGNLLSDFIEANIDPTSLVLIMPNTLALSLSLMVNSLGQPEFPGLTMRGGTLMGIPVIASQYAANASGGGNLVIAVNAADILLADDGAVSIDASSEASLQMLDNPTNNAATGTATTMVSMFQTNSIALRAERFITWRKARPEAVVYMDDVNWGSIGSPS